MKKEWTKGCDMGFRVGQQVTGTKGEGVVKQIDNNSNYPIFVKHTNGSVSTYKLDGRLHQQDEYPSLYHLDLAPTFYAPECQPKKGEWCWFWDDETGLYGCVSRYQNKGSEIYYSLAGGFKHCAPFDKNDMTPPWEKEVKG